MNFDEDIYDANGPTDSRPARRKYALGGNIEQQTFHGGVNATDLGAFLNCHEGLIRECLRRVVDRHRAVKYYIRMDIAFSRQQDENVQKTTGGFLVPIEATSNADMLDIEHVKASVLTAIENFNTRGSNWQLDHVIKLIVRSAPYRPLQGSSYIKTPRELEGKRAVVNIQNADEYCFLYSVLAHIHPVKKNSERVGNYLSYLQELNYQGLTFPLKVCDVSKFENLNHDISVNVLYYENKDFSPLYSSPHRERKHHVNLLLLEADGVLHYTLIRTMSRLIHSRTKHNGKTFVCPHCLYPFRFEHCLERHVSQCSIHPAQKVEYPTDKNNKLKFTNIFKTMKVPFCLYLDLESFLVPQNDSKVKAVHEPSGFCVLRVSEFKEFSKPAYTYSGSNVIDHLFEYLRKEEQEIFKIVSRNLTMNPLSKEQEKQYESSTHCEGCNKSYTVENVKVHHHSHINGNFIGAYCNNCNLQLKYRRATSFSGQPSFYLPVVCHNLRNYDGHLLIKRFKQYEITNSKGVSKPVEINIIPTNTEKYMSFSIGGLRFIDSFQFLSSSLDSLVKCIAKDGTDTFKYTAAHFPGSSLVYEKGQFPYEYFTGPEVFNETRLPAADKFYSSLNEECISTDDYERAQKMWVEFGCKTLQNYHDLYLTLDTVLLGDMFENFRTVSYAAYKIDPLHYISLPGYSWDAMLKMTEIELELLTDPDTFLFLENNIRGGISMISSRYAKANNEFLVDKEEFIVDNAKSCIMYYDANALYACAMSKPLPTGKFRFLSESEILNFDVMRKSDNDTMGYILEVDLEYPPSLHDLHSDYPLAPERVKVTQNMLSPYCLSFSDKHTPMEKLVPNLNDKKNYVLHYENLKLYLQLGLKLTRIHRVLEFQQSYWLAKYVNYNMERRKEAETEFEKDFFKLCVNSVFGKTMENLRHRINAKLVNCPKRVKKLIAKPSCQEFKIINEDLVMVKMLKETLLQNKPIYVGYSILELSKVHMYDFYYNVIKKHYPTNSTLLFTDTDSLAFKFDTDDIYMFMHDNLHLFDTSNYPSNHTLFSRDNEKKIGKFKDECKGVAALEFVGLRPKMYSLLVSKNKTKMTCKGVKRGYVDKHVRHDMFLNSLRKRTKTTATFQQFQSKNHVVTTVEVNKYCLSAFDDKRYILNDGEKTLAYGHYSICQQDR